VARRCDPEDFEVFVLRGPLDLEVRPVDFDRAEPEFERAVFLVCAISDLLAVSPKGVPLARPG